MCWSAPTAQTSAQDYTGYWRIGGDNTWGGNSSNYFQGLLDEVAIYGRALTDAERLDHFTKGGGDLPNVNPTADFTFTVDKLAVQLQRDDLHRLRRDGRVLPVGLR